MSKRRLWTLIAAPGLALASLLLVFLLLGRSTAGATPEVRSPETTFTVSGTVLNAAAEPISDVVVYAWKRYAGSGFVGDVSDSSGYYSVTLDGGNYDLNFAPVCGSGYASKSYRGIAGPPDQTLNVVLSSGHTVSGTVFATDGSTPVGDVTIYAFNRHTADGFGLPPTDDQGHYCAGLVTGTYELSFTPPPCLGLGPHTEELTITRDTSRDVTLPPGFTVAGCVADGSGESVPGVQVYADDPNIRGFGFAPTDGSGCCTGTLPFTGTPPTGTYDVQFIPPPGLGLGSVTVIDVVSTSAGCPNATLPVTLPAGYTLFGRVTCNGVGVKNVFVYALSKGPHDPRNSLPGHGVSTVDDGSYELPLVPDTYRVEFIPPEAAGLDAEAFTTVELITDTVLDVDFCICSGTWVTETVDSAGDKGRYTSLALAPTYPHTSHIGYSSLITENDYDLKHAWLSGSIWLSETVDHRGGESSSIALVPMYPHTPCVAYQDWWEEGDLRYACRDSTSWTVKTVVSGLRSSYPSLALEPTYPYTPHMSYYAAWGDSLTLGYAYLSGTTWCTGTWVRGPVEPAGSRAGWDNSLALESVFPYVPHISYHDRDDGDLRHAWLSGTTWLTETVDSRDFVGRYTSLGLDSRDNPHVSYFDGTNDTLKYACLSGTTWFSETVDYIGNPHDNPGGWGTGYTSLGLDRADVVYISYYDAIKGDLKLARRDGTVWIVQTVDSSGDVGQYSSLALDAVGCPHISYYDATHGDLRYAYIPAVYSYVHLPIIMRDYR